CVSACSRSARTGSRLKVNVFRMTRLGGRLAPAPTGNRRPGPAIEGRRRERSGAGLAERLADGVENPLGLERLDHEVLGAGLDGLEHLRLLAERGAHDDLRR